MHTHSAHTLVMLFRASVSLHMLFPLAGTSSYHLLSHHLLFLANPPLAFKIQLNIISPRKSPLTPPQAELSYLPWCPLPWYPTLASLITLS